MFECTIFNLWVISFYFYFFLKADYRCIWSYINYVIANLMPCFAIEKSRLKEKNEKFKTDIAVMLVLGKGYHFILFFCLSTHAPGGSWTQNFTFYWFKRQGSEHIDKSRQSFSFCFSLLLFLKLISWLPYRGSKPTICLAK